MRTVVAMVLVPVMKLTGFRFSKDYRWEKTLYHKIVYRMVGTVGANVKAGL
jgi:hypothetical protein